MKSDVTYLPPSPLRPFTFASTPIAGVTEATGPDSLIAIELYVYFFFLHGMLRSFFAACIHPDRGFPALYHLVSSPSFFLPYCVSI